MAIWMPKRWVRFPIISLNYFKLKRDDHPAWKWLAQCTPLIGTSRPNWLCQKKTKNPVARPNSWCKDVSNLICAAIKRGALSWILEGVLFSTASWYRLKMAQTCGTTKKHTNFFRLRYSTFCNHPRSKFLEIILSSTFKSLQAGHWHPGWRQSRVTSWGPCGWMNGSMPCGKET